MFRSTATVIALLAAAPCLAQTSQPAAGKLPVQEQLAAAWKQAKAKRLIQPRLLAPRHFVARRSTEIYVATVGGTVKAGVTTLTIRLQQLAREASVSFEYEVGPDGKLRRFAAEELKVRASGERRQEREESVVAGGELSVNRIKNGKARKGSKQPWSADSLPQAFMWFVLPSLHDLGFPSRLTINEVADGNSRRQRQVPFARATEAPESRPGGTVHRFQVGKGFTKAEIVVDAEGPTAGQVREVKIGSFRHFKRASAKEAQALLASAPLFRNEAQAVRALKQLDWAQRARKQKGKPFAKGLEALEAEDSFLGKAIKTAEASYLVLLRASPDASKWMAIAVPVEPGKTGRRFFVTNHDGKLFASEAKLELSDDCAIPPAAKPYP